MVRSCHRVDGTEATTSTTENPRVTVIPTVVPPLPNLLGGGIEHIPQHNFTISDPILEEVTPETQMMDRMMLAVNKDMAQQQEVFLKLLEDRNTNNRRHETVAENIVGGGSGGTENDEVATTEARPGPRVCSFKTFFSCQPPMFKGDDDLVVSVNWIREIEKAFRTSECKHSQKAMFGSQMLRGATLTCWNVYSMA